jgi:hypothetical protein
VIEVQINIKRRTIVNWSGFPEDTDDDEIFKSLMTIWGFGPGMRGSLLYQTNLSTQTYIMATAIFLTEYYESTPGESLESLTRSRWLGWNTQCRVGQPL